MSVAGEEAAATVEKAQPWVMIRAATLVELVDVMALWRYGSTVARQIQD